MWSVRILIALMTVSALTGWARAQPGESTKERIQDIENQIRAIQERRAITKSALEQFQGEVMLYPAVIKADGTAEPVVPGEDPSFAAAKQKGTVVTMPVPADDFVEHIAMMMMLGEIKREGAKKLIDSFKEHAKTAKLKRLELQAEVRLLNDQIARLESARELLLSQGANPGNPVNAGGAGAPVVYDLYQADAKNPSVRDKGSVGKPLGLSLQKLEGGKFAAQLDLGKELGDQFKPHGIPQVISIEGKRTGADGYLAQSKEVDQVTAKVAEFVAALPYLFVPGAEKPAMQSKVNSSRVVLTERGDNLLVTVEFDVTVRIGSKSQAPQDTRIREAFHMVGSPRKAK